MVMKYKKGQKIPIKVGGKEYMTVIDSHGTQRFIANKLLQHLSDTGQIDLNKLSVDYQNKVGFTKREYAEFNMQIGYSVAGFSELHLFQDYKIENPLWE